MDAITNSWEKSVCVGGGGGGKNGYIAGGGGCVVFPHRES